MNPGTRKLIIGYISEVFSVALIVTSIMIFITIIHETSMADGYDAEYTRSVRIPLTTETMAEEFAAANDGYIIREYEGMIAVFLLDDPYPISVFDINISELSEDANYALKRGITVNGINEVNDILEKLLR